MRNRWLAGLGVALVVSMLVVDVEARGGRRGGGRPGGVRSNNVGGNINAGARTSGNIGKNIGAQNLGAGKLQSQFNGGAGANLRASAREQGDEVTVSVDGDAPRLFSLPLLLPTVRVSASLPFERYPTAEAAP